MLTVDIAISKNFDLKANSRIKADGKMLLQLTGRWEKCLNIKINTK